MPVSGWHALGAPLKSVFQFSFVQKEFAVHAPAHCESKHSMWRQSRGLILKKQTEKPKKPMLPDVK